MRQQPAAQPVAATPIDPEDARVRIGYGLLLGLAGLFLCCFPAGIAGAWFPFTVLNNIEAIPDAQDQEDIKRRAFIAFGVCLASVVLSVLGYSFALFAGCD